MKAIARSITAAAFLLTVFQLPSSAAADAPTTLQQLCYDKPSGERTCEAVALTGGLIPVTVAVYVWSGAATFASLETLELKVRVDDLDIISRKGALDFGMLMPPQAETGRQMPVTLNHHRLTNLRLQQLKPFYFKTDVDEETFGGLKELARTATGNGWDVFVEPTLTRDDVASKRACEASGSIHRIGEGWVESTPDCTGQSAVACTRNCLCEGVPGTAAARCVAPE